MWVGKLGKQWKRFAWNEEGVEENTCNQSKLREDERKRGNK